MRIGFFGAPGDTPNMGVSALFQSTIALLDRNLPGISVTVFDNGLGLRTSTVPVDDGREVTIELRGARGGRRYDRPENLTGMSLLSRMGPIGPLFNTNLRVIDGLTGLLDISGGDSFTDLYGAKRFWSVALPKLIAIRRGVPLILLPQTYGPFKNPRMRQIAKLAVRGAAQCWARDERSFQNLKELLGESFDPDRHRCGVDVAFGLQPQNTSSQLPEKIRRMLDDNGNGKPTVGFNVSGLIYNSPDKARSQYGFRSDYNRIVHEFLRWLLEKTESNLILIPHVMSEPGHYESDSDALLQLQSQLSPDYVDRIAISPTALDPRQVKWLIGQTDWFCGTRMHSTIAALSSAVPTATISYSDKAQGVFERCGQGGQVFDPRKLETPQIIEMLQQSFSNRHSIGVNLDRRLPEVCELANKQAELICSFIASQPPRSDA